MRKQEWEWSNSLGALLLHFDLLLHTTGLLPHNNPSLEFIKSHVVLLFSVHQALHDCGLWCSYKNLQLRIQLSESSSFKSDAWDGWNRWYSLTTSLSQKPLFMTPWLPKSMTASGTIWCSPDSWVPPEGKLQMTQKDHVSSLVTWMWTH